MITATLIEVAQLSDRSDLDQRLYKLSEPISFGWDKEGQTEFVLVSGLVHAFDTGRPETYIFPADEHGHVIDWGELPGSFRGDVDHTQAIANAGWELVSP